MRRFLKNWKVRAAGAKPAAVMLAGLGLVTWGLYQIYAPLGPIFAGTALVIEVLTSRTSGGES